MTPSKYSKFISREIIEESKYSRISAPMVKYRGDRGGKNLTFDWYCVTQPLVMDDEPEVNGFDQYLFFAGSNIEDLKEFQAEIELPLGKEGKKQKIDDLSLKPEVKKNVLPSLPKSIFLTSGYPVRL